LLDISLKNASSFPFCCTGNNQITGRIPNILGKLRKLDTLWVGELFLECSTYHAKIEYLHLFFLLENNKITGDISLDLDRLKHLREISFSK